MISDIETIADLESVLAAEFSAVLKRLNLVPAGLSSRNVHVSVRHADRRKVRSDASSDKWNPGSHSLEVSFDTPEVSPPIADRAALPFLNPTESEASLGRVTKALADLEQSGKLSFIALKWFRDTHLPTIDRTWSAEDCRAHLMKAIQEGLIRTRKVPNPTSPYPTTAIELDRQNPFVQKTIGGTAPGSARFRPVHLDGEPLSQEVLRGRK